MCSASRFWAEMAMYLTKLVWATVRGTCCALVPCFIALAFRRVGGLGATWLGERSEGSKNEVLGGGEEGDERLHCFMSSSISSEESSSVESGLDDAGPMVDASLRWR